MDNGDIFVHRCGDPGSPCRNIVRFESPLWYFRSIYGRWRVLWENGRYPCEVSKSVSPCFELFVQSCQHRIQSFP